MDFSSWLQELGRDANAGLGGFQPQPLYIFVSVVLPVGIGLLVGFGLRFVEQVLGIELGKGARH
jgi:hypothetical protein